MRSRLSYPLCWTLPLSGGNLLLFSWSVLSLRPMDCSTSGFPILRQLLELAQTHIRRVGDAIQPSYHLLPTSPPAFDLSQHQGLFQ